MQKAPSDARGFFCYSSSHLIFREINIIPPRITNKPKLPANSAKSFNWMSIKIKLYNSVKVEAT